MNIRLYIYDCGEDEPKKCTGRKLSRFGYATIVKELKKLPRNAILLDPRSPWALAPIDKVYAERYGLIAIDCSWATVEETFKMVDRYKYRFVKRALPLLLAVNPVNFGKWATLTTLEAFAGAIYILGYESDAIKLLMLYKWAQNFIKLNQELLEAYRVVNTSSEIVAVQNKFIAKFRSGGGDGRQRT